MLETLDDILEEASRLNLTEIEEVIKATCKSIEIQQESSSKIIKSQIDRLDFILDLIEKNYIFIEKPYDIIREISAIIRLLLAYESIIESKMEHIERIYKDLI